VFETIDRDRDGSMTQAEFETIPLPLRDALRAANVEFKFPVDRATFEKAYGKYLEERRSRP
jgi:hypothetical protein